MKHLPRDEPALGGLLASRDAVRQMMDIPETRDLFTRQPRARHLDLGWRLGSDLGAEIVLLDDGQVVAVTEDRTALVNSSGDQSVESLRVVGELRDRLRAILTGQPMTSASRNASYDCGPSTDEPMPQGEYWSLIIEQIRDEQF